MVMIVFLSMVVSPGGGRTLRQGSGASREDGVKIGAMALTSPEPMRV
jgi:hypothetical protein